jgi:hypothetical protein
VLGEARRGLPSVRFGSSAAADGDKGGIIVKKEELEIHIEMGIVGEVERRGVKHAEEEGAAWGGAGGFAGY